jgi:hypothetical protein
MNFNELTRIMLSSMDFFELRRTAARYSVPFQGVRRSKLLRDLERKITAKNAGAGQVAISAEDLPQNLTSAKSAKRDKNAGRMTTINTISSGNAITRFQE